MQKPRDPGLAAQLFGATPERTLALMRAAWPAAVGPEVARRTELVALDGGVLRVRVPDATWRRGLWRMRGDILARLRSIAGKAAPRSLGFVEGPVALVEPAAEAPPPNAPPPLPPSLIEASETIADPELRGRFLAVAGRYLGRFGSSSPSADGGSGAGTGSGAGAGSAKGAGTGSVA